MEGAFWFSGFRIVAIILISSLACFYLSRTIDSEWGSICDLVNPDIYGAFTLLTLVGLDQGGTARHTVPVSLRSGEGR